MKALMGARQYGSSNFNKAQTTFTYANPDKVSSAIAEKKSDGCIRRKRLLIIAIIIIHLSK